MTDKMSLEYRTLDNVEPELFLPVLNAPTVRAHLIDHTLFDAYSIRQWINAKLKVDATPGCRVRAIICSGQLIGWCAIQREKGAYEIAIVLDRTGWGFGKIIFEDIVGWAREMGHRALQIHFLHTRHEYRFLKKISERVYTQELMGTRFTTYVLAVN